MARDRTGWLAGASVLGSVLASACCIVPLVLFSLGVGGAWMANLTALAPYKPIFLVGAGGLIVAGFVSARRHRRQACSADGYCARPLAEHLVTAALWFATLLVLTAAAWPYLLPLLMGE